MRVLILLFFVFFAPQCFASTLTAGYTPVVAQGGSTPELQNATIYDTGTTNGFGDVGIAEVNPVETLDDAGSFRAYSIYENIPQQVTGGGIAYACWNAKGQLVSQPGAC